MDNPPDSFQAAMQKTQQEINEILNLKNNNPIIGLFYFNEDANEIGKITTCLDRVEGRYIAAIEDKQYLRLIDLDLYNVQQFIWADSKDKLLKAIEEKKNENTIL